jgi:hypothetical protein
MLSTEGGWPRDRNMLAITATMWCLAHMGGCKYPLAISSRSQYVHLPIATYPPNPPSEVDFAEYERPSAQPARATVLCWSDNMQSRRLLQMPESWAGSPQHTSFAPHPTVCYNQDRKR